jgi:hypothetical protein
MEVRMGVRTGGRMQLLAGSAVELLTGSHRHPAAVEIGTIPAATFALLKPQGYQPRPGTALFGPVSVTKPGHPAWPSNCMAAASVNAADRANDVLGTHTTRKPMLLFLFSGSFLLRLADRQFLGLLFQEPPRNTRDWNGEMPDLH